MKKERTIKQLLELMLEHQGLFRDGLCYWARSLYYTDNITFKELNALHEYIKENRPKNLYWFSGSAYHWKYGNIKPRIKWIKRHVSKL